MTPAPPDKTVQGWANHARRAARALAYWAPRAFGVAVLALVVVVLLLRFVNPPLTPYVAAESLRLDGVRQDWVRLDAISPDMRRAVIAAEDAWFCDHWGFDVTALRAALQGGAARGGSTITQQTVKNVFLWQGRSWVRKGIEAAITPLTELIWPKRRILELYLNIAEFDEGVFGVQAAAQWYFGVQAADLTLGQASALAAVLPNPKQRSARAPSAGMQARARSIASGAETLAAEGRATCVGG